MRPDRSAALWPAGSGSGGGPSASRSCLLGLALLLGLGAPSPAHAGPITFNTALPIARGQGIFRLQGATLRATDDPSARDRALTAVAAPAVLVYGLTERLALFGVVPLVVHKSLDVTLPSGRANRESTGFGDVSAFARYTVLQIDRPGATLRLAPFAGLKTPTGAHHESDRFGRLPRPLQPGSGSWDPFLGATLTWQTLAWELDADAGYRFNTRADGFAFGDVATTDLSFQYRVLPRRLGPGVPAFFYAVLESNLEWAAKNRIGGRVDSDSGGLVWSLDPGLQLVTRRLVLEAVVRIPVVQALNGDALGRDYEVRAGLRWNFWLPF